MITILFIRMLNIQLLLFGNTIARFLLPFVLTTLPLLYLLFLPLPLLILPPHLLLLAFLLSSWHRNITKNFIIIIKNIPNYFTISNVIRILLDPQSPDKLNPTLLIIILLLFNLPIRLLKMRQPLRYSLISQSSTQNMNPRRRQHSQPYPLIILSIHNYKFISTSNEDHIFFSACEA